MYLGDEWITEEKVQMTLSAQVEPIVLVIKGKIHKLKKDFVKKNSFFCNIELNLTLFKLNFLIRNVANEFVINNDILTYIG